ncbi:MAG: Smr/MutS family protein [Sphaerochaetaceae bacterium]|nr:Smr/MutS family protein [Sphaerochaetaceae bacterium]
MAKQSFADIFEQWENLQKDKEGKKTAPVKSPPKTKALESQSEQKNAYTPTESFADIYDAWTQSHDEDKAMKRKANASGLKKDTGPSINQIRKMDAQAELDLHEVTLEEAKRQTAEFLENCYAKGLRKVRIVTGKGIHSKNGEAVLKPVITAVVTNHPRVREVFTPKAAEGGSGALSVILKGRM